MLCSTRQVIRVGDIRMSVSKSVISHLPANNQTSFWAMATSDK
jgi:hypothetical protein